MTHHLFVYGTLAPGREPAAVRPLVARLSSVGPASVPGSLYDFGPYPGVVLDGSEGRVFGHLFDVPDDDRLWHALDVYEGFDPREPNAGLYRRKHCVARLDSGADIECQIYVCNGVPPDNLRVAEGRWKPTEMRVS